MDCRRRTEEHYPIKSIGEAAKGQEMYSHWQEQLLALVARYGEQCSQMATERARGIHEHPPADRAGAWAAIVSHLAKVPRPAEPRQTVGSA